MQINHNKLTLKMIYGGSVCLQPTSPTILTRKFSFKTYLDYTPLPYLKRELKQNSLQLQTYKDSLSLDSNLINIIRGGLLGDITGIRRSNSPTDSLKIEQKLDRKEYVDHLYYVFYNFVGTPPAIRLITGGGSNDRKSYWFRTYGHKKLGEIITPFYQFNHQLNKYIKVVPIDITQWLNPQVIAYWFMDDGSRTKQTLYLNTQSFTYDEQLLLQKALLGLNIKCSIKKDKIEPKGEIFNKQSLSQISNDKNLYKLEINSESTPIFIQLIKPYILPIFNYKIGINK
jgi:hypothetical protein